MNLHPQTTAFVFPGQGSQAVRMGKELAKTYPIARETFDEADSILGFALSQLMENGPADELNATINTQPALYVHSVAVWRTFAILHPDFLPATVAGYLLGELLALTVAGALPFSVRCRVG